MTIPPPESTGDVSGQINQLTNSAASALQIQMAAWEAIANQQRNNIMAEQGLAAVILSVAKTDPQEAATAMRMLEPQSGGPSAADLSTLLNTMKDD